MFSGLGGFLGRAFDGFAGPQKPFPEGDERERINRAIDDLVAAMRALGTI